ncbi:dihydrolipoyl dehydrogenase [Sodalis-like secondary symbiont of Drepanosiphum platanoidis]|uniref:dihydrolipoyl dehydrogenase n=1 Tax=Sodalis-like secondary symbiont of Drepanosiphum platanoidis TaxID=2994493 RepID=UPI003464E6E7
MIKNNIKTHVVVIGSGPSGYSAAFRCSDLGLKTILIERHINLGGVCLNVGCIPSKTLLHISKIINEYNFFKQKNIFLNKIEIDLFKIKSWKKKIIENLSFGLNKMFQSRNIEIIQGNAKFINKNLIQVENSKNKIFIEFEYAIIATGSYPINFPFLLNKENKNIWNSTDALNLKFIPNKLLIIGGGIISLEMATIYHSLGSKIDIVEISDQIIPLADKDIINIFIKILNNKFKFILKTKVISISNNKNKILVKMEDKNLYIYEEEYDAVIIAIGRYPNSKNIGINKLGIKLNSQNFIKVNNNLQTNIKNIYAIGDVIGQPMLAHKGMKEGHIVAEIISGKKYIFNPKIIPYIAYTDPEIAWVGLTEKNIKDNEKNKFEITKFPWSASGRAISSGATNGITKLIFNKKTNRIVGGSVVGINGGEILGEIGLAIEMGCEAEDISLTIHAHPTLYESIGLSSEIYTGSITDLINNKINKKIFKN